MDNIWQVQKACENFALQDMKVRIVKGLTQHLAKCH